MKIQTKKILGIILPIVFIIGIILFAAFATTQFLFLDKLPGEQSGTANSVITLGPYKGFFVRTGANKDFPSQQGLDSKSQKAELQKIVKFAKESGFNAIFFEARPDGSALYSSRYFPTSSTYVGSEGGFTFFDPLEYLSTLASQEDLALYAVVNTYGITPEGKTLNKKNPLLNQELITTALNGQIALDPSNPQVHTLLANSCQELVDKYAISGVLLDGISQPGLWDAAPTSYADTTQTMLTLVSAAMKAQRPDAQLGVIVDGVPQNQQFVFSPQQVGKWVSDGTVDIVMPQIYTTMDAGENDYVSLATQWSGTVVEGDKNKVVVGMPVYKFTGESRQLENPEEISRQLFVNAFIPTINGAVFDSYSDLYSNPDQTETLMSFLWEASSATSDLNLTIPQTLAISYPLGAMELPYATYYITGTSNPALPLYLDGEELTRTTEGGAFGVLVTLEMGRNIYVFSQGETQLSVTLDRYDPTVKAAEKITDIVKSSVFPLVSYGSAVGTTFEIKCTAPAGGAVTATLGNQSVVLKQVRQAAAGTPAQFVGDYIVPDTYPVGEVVNAGNITYTLSYNGVNSIYRSLGDVFIAGKDARLAVEVTDFHAAVFEDPQTQDYYATSLAAGARDYTVGYENGRIQLESGGFVPPHLVQFIEGKFNLENHVFDMFYLNEEKSETFSLPCQSKNYYRVEESAGKIEITFANTVFDYTDFSALSMYSFASVQAENNTEDGSATLTFTLKDGVDIWGWDVSFDQQGVVIYFKKPPVLSDKYSRPLEGITIVVDPGHGGTDPGALGAAGEHGPFEAKMNLAVASILRHRLEQLGATVVMTRSDSETALSLQQRQEIPFATKPDFFISVHHNSSGYTTDANLVSGTQVYYHYDRSLPFAQHLMQQLSTRITRQTEDPYYANFYVTRISYAPAVLLEMAYISNPAEQEKACNSIEIFNEACGIAWAVVETLRGS